MRLLREAQTGMARITYTKRPALYASECSACGRLFRMDDRAKDITPAHLKGIFDRCAEDEDGRGLGNVFSATACSFACADVLFSGGWRKMEQYQPYVKVGAILERTSVTITTHVKTESDLIAEWESEAERPAPHTEADMGLIYIGGGFLK